MLRLYAKLPGIEQGEKETPGKFLDYGSLSTSLYWHWSWNYKGEIILKDRFLTKLAPDICHKLWKQVFEPNQSLEELLQLAQIVYYGREYKE